MATERHPGVESRSRHLLREFVAARGRGDRTAMQRTWGELLTVEWPRVTQLVAIRGRGLLVTDAERDDALRETAMRLAKHGPRKFEGVTLDAWFSFVNTVADFSAREIQRVAAKHAKKHRSLDERDAESGDTKAWVSNRYAELERERVETAAVEAEQDDELARRQAFLAWAVPQLSPKRRAVWQALADGKRPEDIAVELGMSRNSVDQTKKRAITDLSKLKEEFPS